MHWHLRNGAQLLLFYLWLYESICKSTYSDAKLPACSTCMKSHGAVIAAKVIKGEPFEPYPECTYKHRPADEDTLQPGQLLIFSVLP